MRVDRCGPRLAALSEGYCWERGHTGKLMLGTFATLAVAATSAIWLLILLVGSFLDSAS